MLDRVSVIVRSIVCYSVSRPVRGVILKSYIYQPHQTISAFVTAELSASKKTSFVIYTLREKTWFWCLRFRPFWYCCMCRIEEYSFAVCREVSKSFVPICVLAASGAWCADSASCGACAASLAAAGLEGESSLRDISDGYSKVRVRESSNCSFSWKSEMVSFWVRYFRPQML